jgi:hypothetical protein
MKTILLHFLIALSINACSSTALGDSTWEIYEAKLSPAEAADSPLKQKALQALLNREIKGTQLVVNDSLLKMGQEKVRVRKITAEQILIETEEGPKTIRYRLSEDQQVCKFYFENGGMYAARRLSSEPDN